MTTFQHNLKALSVKTGDSYLDEWIIEGFDKSDSFEDRCICCRKIKHKYILRNILNGYFVQVGTSCIKKLTDPAGNILQSTKKSINQCITDSFSKGVFVPIKDLHQYSIDVITQYLLENTPEKIYEMYELYKSNRKVSSVICDIKKKRFSSYWRMLFNYSETEPVKKIWLDTICPKNISIMTSPRLILPIQSLNYNEDLCNSCGCYNRTMDLIGYYGHDYCDFAFCYDCMSFYDITDEEQIASKRLINNINFKLDIATGCS